MRSRPDRMPVMCLWKLSDMNASITLQDQRAEMRAYRVRALIAYVVVVLGALILALRIGYLQVQQYEVYKTESDKNRLHVQSVAPTRGLIYDRNGVLLAENRPIYSLTLVKERADDVEATLAALGGIVDLTDAELERFRDRLNLKRRPFESIPLRFKLSEEEIARIAVNRHALPGVEVEAQLARYYPFGALFAHSVGYVGRINKQELESLDQTDYAGTHHIGKIGVELYYEKFLHGTVGHQQVETNARGQVLRVISRADPIPGENMVLSLDTRLQQEAIDALQGRRGAVVAIEVKTGGVLALVSEPAYDPNPFVAGIDTKSYAALRESPDLPLFNRALRGRYPPGSTIKPFFGIAGLSAGVVNRRTSIQDPGFFQLPNDERKYRDWKKQGHGRVNLHKAIVQSCDTYFYELAFNLGVDRSHEFMSRFGFGRATGVDIHEEVNGLLPSREWKLATQNDSWYHGDTVNIGIGQGFMLVTPMRLATATAMLARRGAWVQPRLLQSLGGSEIEPASATQPDLQLRNAGYWEQVLTAMRDVIHSVAGTAQRISVGADYEMGGKTGTAQVIGMAQDEEYDEEKVAEMHRDHALFIAFAPYDDPEIAVAVIVENGGHGGSAAAPVARRIFDTYLTPEQSRKPVASAAGAMHAPQP